MIPSSKLSEFLSDIYGQEGCQLNADKLTVKMFNYFKEQDCPKDKIFAAVNIIEEYNGLETLSEYPKYWPLQKVLITTAEQLIREHS